MKLNKTDFPEIVEKSIEQKIEYPSVIEELFNKEKNVTILNNDIESVKDYIKEKALN